MARAASRIGISKRKEMWAGYLFALPALIGIIGFMLAPVVYTLFVSFRDYRLLSPVKPFVGFDNYMKMLEDPIYRKAFFNTVYYAVGTVPLQVIVSLGLALLVQKHVRGLGIFRTAFYLPVVTSMVVVSTLFRLMYDSQSGIINGLLMKIGIPPQPFLTSTVQAMPSLIAMNVWKWVGFSMLVFLGGLQSIPNELYESAQIDGANWGQTFRHITLPMLRGVALFVIVNNTINAFKVFTSVYVMTEGGPANSTVVLAFYIFRRAFRYMDFGYAAAMSVSLFLFVLLLTLVQFRVLRRDSMY